MTHLELDAKFLVKVTHSFINLVFFFVLLLQRQLKREVDKAAGVFLRNPFEPWFFFCCCYKTYSFNIVTNILKFPFLGDDPSLKELNWMIHCDFSLSPNICFTILVRTPFLMWAEWRYRHQARRKYRHQAHHTAANANFLTQMQDELNGLQTRHIEQRWKSALLLADWLLLRLLWRVHWCLLPQLQATALKAGSSSDWVARWVTGGEHYKMKQEEVGNCAILPSLEAKMCIL